MVGDAGGETEGGLSSLMNNNTKVAARACSRLAAGRAIAMDEDVHKTGETRTRMTMGLGRLCGCSQ
jgi:hypothetical protein